MAAVHHPKHEIIRHDKPRSILLEHVDTVAKRLASERAKEEHKSLSTSATERFMEGFAADLMRDELSKPPVTIPE